jgi:MerR family transcriptional regulator, light-induced transcriptional regulator
MIVSSLLDVQRTKQIRSEVSVKDAIRLGNYSTKPLYNIKAVVQATNISPSTLRAWERRYNMCQPQRSESGYRLYSDRDVAIIRWLKAQVEAGMAISQAVSRLEALNQEADSAQDVVLPTTEPAAGPEREISRASTERRPGLDLSTLRRELLQALLEFDELTADQVMSEAFALYSLGEVGERLILPVLDEIGRLWAEGKLNSTREHYATTSLRQRLEAVLRATPNPTGRPSIWIACAPGELHEITSVLLTLELRHAGFQAHFFGQNIHLDDFVAEVRYRKPQLVILSATTETAAEELARLAHRLVEDGSASHPIPIGYGGRIFNLHPERRAQIPGIFLGMTIQEAIASVHEILHRGGRPGPWQGTEPSLSPKEDRRRGNGQAGVADDQPAG